MVMLAVWLGAGLTLLPAHRPHPTSGARVRCLWMAQDDGNAADDLNSAFAARLRAVSGSDKPSEIRASETAAAMREKAEAARRKADSVKSDAADFLAGGKKQVAAGRAYNGDDLAEVRQAGRKKPTHQRQQPACVRMSPSLARQRVGPTPIVRALDAPFRSTTLDLRTPALAPYPLSRPLHPGPWPPHRWLGTTRATWASSAARRPC